MTTTNQPPRSAPVPDEVRRAQLQRTLANLTASGSRVETASEYDAVVVRGKRPNHVLHLLLTVLTLGLWSLVWLLLAVVKHERRASVHVDEFGRVTVT